MFSTDQSHLRKYLTTLGIAIVGGVVSITALAMRLQDDLLLKEAELAELTPVARETLERRQHFAEVVTTLLPWFFFVGISAGLILTGFGILGWAKRQRVADDIEDTMRDRARHELQQLSQLEREDRLTQEAVQSLAETPPVVADARKTISELHASLAVKLHMIFGPLNVQQQVVMQGPPSPIRVDFVTTRPQSPTYVINVKYVGNSEHVSRRFKEALLSAREFVDVIGPMGHPCVVLVLADSLAAKVSQMEEQLHRLDPVSARLVATVSEFEAMPASELAKRLGMPAPGAA